MRDKLSKVASLILLVALIIGASIFIATRFSSPKYHASIITSNFAGYDFARAVIGDASEVAMLLKPGTETHDYEPTPEDIINIKNADLFIYVGGESDAWIDDLITSSEISANHTLRLMDYVDAKVEELPEGMEDSNISNVGGAEEYDEHIWTSPVNAISLVSSVRDKLISLHPDSASIYNENAAAYIKRLQEIDQSIRDVVSNSNKNTLIFADRFPFRYFVDEYGLNYFAAFPGCSEQTEASSKTISFLINKVKADDINVVLKIELTSSKLAENIAAETNARVLELHAGHNISQADFTSGVTLADIMLRNVEVLREALK